MNRGGYMYFLFDSLSKNVVDIFRRLMLLLSTCVLELISYVFDIFIRLGKAEVLTSTQVQTIYSRVSLILGIFMLFKLSFSFVQYMLNPETMSDKNKGAGKLIMKSIVVVALLGMTPFLFSSAYELQNKVLDSNILAKIIFASNSDSDVNDFGIDLASILFFSFYSSNVEDIGSVCTELGDDMDILRDEIIYHHSFNSASSCLNDSLEQTTINPTTWRHTLGDGYLINFRWHGIILVVVSVIVLYLLVSYCISVGVRVIQLAFLQLIAPIPILSYLGEDKDGAFSNWIKRVVSTFLDLFIRLAVIYFAVYAIELIIANDASSSYYFLETVGNPTGLTKVLINIVIIIAILTFAKKVPDLIKELLPKGIGNNIGFGLDLGKNLKNAREMASPAGRAIGFAGGALAGGLISGKARFSSNKKAGKNLRQSLLGAAGGVGVGLISGGLAGGKKDNMFKNVGSVVKNRRVSDNKYNDLVNSGGSSVGKFISSITDPFGETKGQMYTRRKNDLSTLSSYKKNMNSSADEITAVSRLKSAYESMQQFDGESAEHFSIRKNQAQQLWKSARKAAQEVAINNNGSVSLNTAFEWSGESSFDVSGFDFRDPNGYANASSSFSAKLDEQWRAYSQNGGRKDMSEFKNSIVSEYNNFLHQVSDPDYKGSKEFQYNVNYAATFADEDDVAYATQINSSIVQAETYRKSHNVQRLDENNNWVNVDSISDRKSLSNTETYKNETDARVSALPDYASSIANDKAAGVDSNATSNR